MGRQNKGYTVLLLSCVSEILLKKCMVEWSNYLLKPVTNKTKLWFDKFGNIYNLQNVILAKHLNLIEKICYALK